MFDSLRKKLSDAIKGLAKREETEIKEGEVKVEQTPLDIPAASPQSAPVQAPPPLPVPPPATISVQPKAQLPETKSEHKPAPVQEKPVQHPPSNQPPPKDAVQSSPPKPVPAALQHAEQPPAHPPQQPHAVQPVQKAAAPKPVATSAPPAERRFEPPVQRPQQRPRPEPEQDKKDDELVKLSLKTKIKSIFISTVLLGDSELEEFTEGLRVSLLQSDVSYDTAEAFTESLRSNLKTTRLDSKDIQGALVAQVRKSLFEILERSRSSIDLSSYILGRVSAGQSPVKILFLGPNGTGKTTTMAKLAYSLKKDGITSVMSASDTFRAAAIEQTEHHANKVGVPVIKSKYGADPASIAFDAIAYAKAHNVNVVLIDSAGRQETNKNLINEMQKMARVAKPDITIFVGESTAGNALSAQIKEFNKFMKIDGIVLTKLDCDAKGGNAISIAYTTGIPLLFIGTGESYDSLVKYTPDFIVNAIAPNN